MILGDLSSVFDEEKTILEAVDNVMSSSNGTYKKPSKFSSILTSLSHYGMNYTDKVYKNMMAVPADKLLQPKDDALLQQTLYGGGLNNWKVKPEEEKSFSEKSLDRLNLKIYLMLWQMKQLFMMMKKHILQIHF